MTDTTSTRLLPAGCKMDHPSKYASDETCDVCGLGEGDACKAYDDQVASRRSNRSVPTRPQMGDFVLLETLRWWRQLVDANPQDLAPRLDAAIERASLPQPPAESTGGVRIVPVAFLSTLYGVLAATTRGEFGEDFELVKAQTKAHLQTASTPAQSGLVEWDEAPNDLRAAVLGRAWALAGKGNPDISHYWRAIKEVAAPSQPAPVSANEQLSEIADDYFQRTQKEKGTGREILMRRLRAAFEAGRSTLAQPDRESEHTVDPGLEHDGLRWRALVNSPRIRMQGWSGFDALGHFEQTMDPRGYMHFGMEVWSHSEGDSGSLGRNILTEYADQRIKQAALTSSTRPQATEGE